MIFNHHDPDTPADHAYFKRAAARLAMLCAGEGLCADRKLLVLLNVERRGALVDGELDLLFAALCASGMRNFDLVAVRVVLPTDAPPPPRDGEEGEEGDGNEEGADGGRAGGVRGAGAGAAPEGGGGAGSTPVVVRDRAVAGADAGLRQRMEVHTMRCTCPVHTASCKRSLVGARAAPPRQPRHPHPDVTPGACQRAAPKADSAPFAARCPNVASQAGGCWARRHLKDR